MGIKNTLSFIIFLFFSLSFGYAEPVEIRILYVNDFHGFAESHRTLGSEKLSGGAQYLAGMVKRLRSEKETLLLSAGDMIQGNNWANLTEGKSVIELMNEMKFDAMVVGNHEFDFGKENLKKRVSEARFPVLGANVVGLDLLKPYLIKEMAGIKVAIIGITTDDTPLSTHPKNVFGFKFLPAKDTVEKYLQVLKGRADIIILLSHIGFSADRSIAERVKGIDVIVGGHSHTRLEKPLLVGHTIVVQAWEHGKALGVLDLTVENGKIIRFRGHLEEISPEIGVKDDSIKSLVDKYGEIIDRTLGETIGRTLCDLDGENVRRKETNLGNFIADIIRDRAGTDIAITNGGGIRIGIKKGEIKIKDIYSILPFDNYIVAIKMPGKKIKEVLEHGVSAVPEEAGRFPQISGMKFTYDPKAPTGSRIREIYIGDKPLESEKEYSVATNDFMAAGGDGYKTFLEVVASSKDYALSAGMIKDGKVLYSDAGRYLRDIVVQYIKKRKVIEPKTEERIKEVFYR
ncbi:MAG: 5'-nucleotidase C-terminal domain-containing protein [Syntrophorhabdaceae bacterium]|nr:5'-nucleotidase C-terminal domain-containing protein [Syntrophorhabdaceae bacterium]